MSGKLLKPLLKKMIKFEELQKYFPEIKKDVPLSDFTTFKIGGAARFFLEINEKRTFLNALDVTKKHNLKLLIIGKGSNLLISDKGFPGLVIKNNLQKIKIENRKVKAESGVLLSHLLNFCLQNNLTGLEWAAGIPGTLGGSIKGNAGSFGKSISDVIETVSALNLSESSKNEEEIFNLEQCSFGYRNSIFNNNPSYFILEASLKLTPGVKQLIAKKIKENISKKTATQDLGKPSAGSIFKNIKVSELNDIQKSKLESFLPYAQNDLLPASLIIDKGLNLKGKMIGEAQISPKHAGYIINTGHASFEDVLLLINFVFQKTLERYKIKLQKEVQIIK
jgi:UDP-N-acetylmuramate dehydrogenase